MSHSSKLIGMLIVVAACSTTPEPEGSLGIANVEITETARTLSISGTNAAGEHVASLELSLGRFVMQDDGRPVDGRQIAIDVLGEDIKHESEGMRSIHLPLFGASSPFDAF